LDEDTLLFNMWTFCNCSGTFHVFYYAFLDYPWMSCFVHFDLFQSCWKYHFKVKRFHFFLICPIWTHKFFSLRSLPNVGNWLYPSWKCATCSRGTMFSSCSFIHKYFELSSNRWQGHLGYVQMIWSCVSHLGKLCSILT